MGNIFKTENACFNDATFGRGMTARKVKIKSFLLMIEARFEERTLKGRSTEVFKRASEELQDQFFDMSLNGDIPESWVNFKNFIVDFCTEKSKFAMHKYKEETWTGYCHRLKNQAKSKKWSEEDLLKKLRHEKLPRQHEVIFFSLGIQIYDAINRVEEWEQNK